MQSKDTREIVKEVLRTNELQTWFITEQLVDTPLVRS
ncbi:hypothetical protein NUACC26_060470 [Scytonema sp. NUACC26]